MFRVGQKVVCVNAGRISDDGPATWTLGCAPVEGRVYTVRATGRCVTDEPGIKVEELELNIRRNGTAYFDTFYRARRFRPVVERKTDISIFERLLAPANHDPALV